jgi:phage baseplate assembly protein W
MAILSTPNKLYKDLDFSFSAHPETGDVLKKIDNNAIKQSIRALVSTAFGERLFDPELGAPYSAFVI